VLKKLSSYQPLIITSGEPAGIGPDLCLSLLGSPHPLVIACDPDVLQARARLLNKPCTIREYQSHTQWEPDSHALTVLPLKVEAPVEAGVLNAQNAPYVLSLLDVAIKGCLSGEFSAMVTAPVHKGIINEAGILFSGHTEYLAESCKIDTVVMMLVCDSMRVALVTTHLPLKAVADAITIPLLQQVIRCVYQHLVHVIGIQSPRIWVAGLNPHAGEQGHLGREELDIIIPALHTLRDEGIQVEGPFPADTMFKSQNGPDVYVAMYHDQGLPVLKYASFGQAVNVTLGLPIIRTSVDHGTALDLAGKGVALSSSLDKAVSLAMGIYS